MVQEITPDLTFGTLVALASNQFGISQRMQRFKIGFPPKHIKMELDDVLVVSYSADLPYAFNYDYNCNRL